MANTNVTSGVSVRLANPKDWKTQKKQMDAEYRKAMGITKTQAELKDWFEDDSPKKPRRSKPRKATRVKDSGRFIPLNPKDHPM